MSQMPEAVRTHLRYPSDLFSVQAAMLGHYHITTRAPSTPRRTVGDLTHHRCGHAEPTLSRTEVTNAAGNVVSTSLSPMSPVYQVGSLPGAEPPAAPRVRGLRARRELGHRPGPHGIPDSHERRERLRTPERLRHAARYVGDRSGPGGLRDSTDVGGHSIITLQDQHGSEVLLGNNLMVPLDQSVLYIRPLYVTSTSNPMPQLRYVIAVFNQDVAISPTLSGALSQVLGASFGGGSTSGSTTTPTGGTTTKGGTAASYLKQASADYTLAQAALQAGNLGQYQADVNAMDAQLKLATTALSK